MTNAYPVHDVLERLVGTHLVRQVVAHIAYYVKLGPFFRVHDVSHGVQVVGEVEVVDEARLVGVVVLLDEQGDVLLVDAERLGQGAVELRLVDDADVVDVELVTQLADVDAAPRVVALKSTHQLFHVDLVLDVEWPQRPTSSQ